jgi:molybdate transport system ATP-binding protein
LILSRLSPIISDPDNDLTLKDYLLGGTEENKESIDRVAKQLDVEHLLHLSFVKLSNGQTRRARIARALLRNPSMLVLDEPLSKKQLLLCHIKTMYIHL